MDRIYDINQLAIITGFTTRTLRSDIAAGTLKGEKIDGMWRFSGEDIGDFLEKPTVRRRSQAKENAVIYDFLADTGKSTNRMCVVLDMPVTAEEAGEVMDFFCGQMNGASRAEFFARQVRGVLRVTLSGAEDQISAILAEYYAWKRSDT